MKPEPDSGAYVALVETIYTTHGCSCEAHYSNGEAASCRAWRRRAAEQTATALLTASAAKADR